MKQIAVLFISFGLVLSVPIEDPKVLQVSHANDDFDGHFLQALEAEAPGKNVFVSSFSVSSAMSMLMAGGATKTYSEIYNTLGYESSKFSNDDIMHGYQKLMSELNNPTRADGNILSIANSLAVQKNRPVLETYMNAITTYFGSQLFVEDFATNPKKATDELNAWVNEKTHAKIPKLFDSPLAEDTAMVLMNAIYFKGIWEHKFEAKETKNEQFHVTREHSETVPLMVQRGTKHYAHFEDGQLLEIPYKNKTMSMFVFLPNENAALKSISSVLSVNKLESRVGQLRNQDVILHLPKFTFEGSYQLKPTLSKLGVNDAFTKAADFSNIDGHKDLYVSKVVHKTFVEVNEEGSEAAAATGVVIRPKSASIHPQPVPVNFRVDRPFMFFIRDNQHQLTLFSGVIHKPEYKH